MSAPASAAPVSSKKSSPAKKPVSAKKAVPAKKAAAPKVSHPTYVEMISVSFKICITFFSFFMILTYLSIHSILLNLLTFNAFERTSSPFLSRLFSLFFYVFNRMLSRKLEMHELEHQDLVLRSKFTF